MSRPWLVFLFAVEDHDVGFVAAGYVDGHDEGLAVGGELSEVNDDDAAVGFAYDLPRVSASTVTARVEPKRPGWSETVAKLATQPSAGNFR